MPNTELRNDQMQLNSPYLITAKIVYFVLIAALTFTPIFALPVCLSAGGLQEAKKVAKDVRKKVVDDDEADGSEDDGDTKDKEETKEPSNSLPFKKKGPLEQIKKQTGEIVKLEVQSGRLTTTFKSSYEEVDPVIDKIREKLGYGGGGGGSSYGERAFRINFSTQKLTGRVEQKIVSKAPMQILQMTETSDLERSLLIQSSEKEGLSITINGGGVPFLFRFKQSPDGKVVIQEVDGAQVFSCTAPNFKNLLQVNSTYSKERLVPLLERFGIGNLKTPYDDDVQRQVLSQLSRLSKNEVEQFVSIAGDINASTFVARNNASKKLTEMFDEHSELMMKVMNDVNFPPETRYRIQQIAQKKQKKDLLGTIRYANQSGLTGDVDYLFWLMEQQQDKATFLDVGQHILSLLELSPEQQKMDFHDDRSISQAWLASRKVAFYSVSKINKANKETEVDPLAEKGSMDKGREQLRNFIRVTIDDNQLSLDREHWKKPFGGKTIKQLSAKIEELVTESNLPKSWYSAGGNHSLSSSDFQQVQFELLSQKFGGSRNNDPYMYYESEPRSSARDRSFESSSIKMQMKDSKSTKRTSRRSTRSKKVSKPVFQLQIQETKKPNRQLVVTEKKDGKVELRYVSEKSDVIMQIVSTSDAVFLHDIRGGKAFAVKAKSFSELAEKQGEYLKQKFFPVFENVGVAIDPAIFNRGVIPAPTGFWGDPDKD